MNSNRKRFLQMISDIRNQRWLLAALTLVITAAFIAIGNFHDKPGFPLDDAWIHQTYARNLAQNGQWEYIPGEESAGSTSPLWTILLSIGFLVGLKTPFLWTSLLSTGMLIGIALVCNEILQHYFEDKPIIGMAGSLILVLDWHLLWSAGSGMETLFYCLACLYIFWLLISGKYWGWLGALCGLIVWIRPDGIIMLGPVFVLIIVGISTRKLKTRDLLLFAIPLIGLIGLYAYFNYSIAGAVLPNTFYAKQVEYAQVLSLPLITRLGNIFLVPISGAGLFLIPGFIYSLINAIRKPNWGLLTLVLWFFGYGAIYALRLPMTYQHGRYLIPLIPVFYVIGFLGTVNLFSRDVVNKTRKTNYSIFAGLIMALISLIFAVSGVIALIDDIRTIDTLMVQPAEWIKENSDQGDVIAVHDIGAMGYFGERRIIDLAGLIQPELIPIIGNEGEIQKFLVESKADYLVILKDWYPGLEDFGAVENSYRLETGTRIEIVQIKKLR